MSPRAASSTKSPASRAWSTTYPASRRRRSSGSDAMDDQSYGQLALTVFWMIFVAELGDKTQIATLLLAADRPGAKWVIFCAAVAALALATLIGVLAGGWVSHYLPEKT